MLCIQVTTLTLLILLLGICTCADVPVTVKTVQQGATVTEPVLKASSLDIDDQLMTTREGHLCAEYFCHNGTCENEPDLESHFEVFSENVCLIIPNVTVNVSGHYSVMHNEKHVLTLTLHVEAFTDVPHPSVSVWLVLVIAVLVIAVVLVLVIRGLIYKKIFPCFQGGESAAPIQLSYI